jgi:hypothetical protein
MKTELHPLDCCVQTLVRQAILPETTSTSLKAYNFGENALAKRAITSLIRNTQYNAPEKLQSTKRTIRKMVHTWAEYYRNHQ